MLLWSATVIVCYRSPNQVLGPIAVRHPAITSPNQVLGPIVVNRPHRTFMRYPPFPRLGRGG